MLFGAASTLGLVVGSTALAQVTNSDILFVVDESGSMAGEHAFLPGFAEDLEAQLLGNGVTPQFGLVGYGGGGAGNDGRTFMVGTGLLGNSAEFGMSAQNLVLSGAFEDGYAGIDFALNNIPATPGASRTVVLVTDEDRDISQAALDFNALQTSLTNQGITLVVIVNGNITSDLGPGALGTDGTTAFVQNGTGFITSPLVSTSGAGTTDADYIQLALQTPNGCAADLNQLRAGGDTATAFAAALQQCLAIAAVGAPLAPGLSVDLFLNVYRDNVMSIQMSIDNQISQIIPLDPAADVIVNALAQATDDTAIVDNLLNVEGLRAYLIVDYMTGDFDRHGNNKEFDYNGGGTVFGVDYTASNLLGAGETSTFGVAGAYHTLNNSVVSPLGTLDTNTFTAQLYAQVKMPEGVYGRANAQVSLSTYKQRRIVGAASFGGETEGIAVSSDLEVGFAFPDILPDPQLGLYLTPFGSVGIDYRRVDSFQESNGGVHVGDFSDKALPIRVGGRATLTYEPDPGTTFFAGLELAGLFDLLDDDSFALINNGTLPNERIESVDAVTVQFGASAGAKVDEQFSVFVGYDGAVSSNTFQNTIGGGVVINF